MLDTIRSSSLAASVLSGLELPQRHLSLPECALQQVPAPMSLCDLLFAEEDAPIAVLGMFVNVEKRASV